MFNAKTIPNFISKADCDMLIDFATKIDPWEKDGSDSFWDNRSLNAVTIYQQHSQEVGQFLYNLRLRISDAIKTLYGVEEIYPDLTQIVRWYPGQEQSPHADDMTDHEGPDVEWFSHRHFGSILYLNDNYSGGHTYYPQHGTEIIPVAGTLAIHPGTPDHLHGVTKIEDNIRYTIASFWTKDRSYFDNWSIY